MSYFDNVEVRFHGGPLDGSVSLPAADLGLNNSPHVNAICASWGDAYRNDRAFAGTVLALTAAPRGEWSLKPNQEVFNTYRVDWVDLRDDRTLFLILSYVGTTGADTPTLDV